ncbi:MAG: hypothetical protein ACYC1M_07925 [Armatimonadota bacterium]
MDRWPRRISPTIMIFFCVPVSLLLSLVVMGVNRGVDTTGAPEHNAASFMSERAKERTAAYIEITCPKCDGTGYVQDAGGNSFTSVPCKLCKGVGKLKFPRKDPPCCHGTGTCSVCSGKGKLPDGRGHIVPCRACEGTGLCGGWIYDKKNGLISRPCLKNR